MSRRHYPQRSPVLPLGRTPATLRLGATDVPYSCRGTGAPVLLLAGDPKLRNYLQSHLAARFRVVAPATGCCERELGSSTWLRGLIDGLGLNRPRIVASDSHALAALHFTASDPERVDRIAVLWRESAGDPADRTMLQDRLTFASAPLLLVRIRPWNGDPEHGFDELADLIRFLESPSEGSMGTPAA